MKFVIRDDDLNYFSDPELVQQWYGSVFAQEIPVSFAAIPFVVPIYPMLDRSRGFSTDREYPFRENPALIDSIKNNPYADILLHGCNHELTGQLYEFAGSDNSDVLYKKIMRGKKELESLFGRTITTFVTPHDQISGNGIRALERAELNLVRGKGTKNFLPRGVYFTAFFKMVAHRMRFAGISRSEMPAYPRVVDLGNHREAFSIRIESSRQALFKALHFAHVTQGNFILVNHIHDFNDTKKQLMFELIHEAKILGAEFVKASDLFALPQDR